MDDLRPFETVVAALWPHLAAEGSRWQLFGEGPTPLVPRDAIDNEFLTSMLSTPSSCSTACSLTRVSCRQPPRGQAHDGKIPSRLRLASLAVLSPGPMLAGTPLKRVKKGGCEGFEDRSGYSPDFDRATVEGKPWSTSSRYSWGRATATQGPYIGRPNPHFS